MIQLIENDIAYGDRLEAIYNLSVAYSETLKNMTPEDQKAFLDKKPKEAGF